MNEKEENKTVKFGSMVVLELLEIADELDGIGNINEASAIDSLLKKIIKKYNLDSDV